VVLVVLIVSRDEDVGLLSVTIEVSKFLLKSLPLYLNLILLALWRVLSYEVFDL
jgi:hypothetical protein